MLSSTTDTNTKTSPLLPPSSSHHHYRSPSTTPTHQCTGNDVEDGNALDSFVEHIIGGNNNNNKHDKNNNNSNFNRSNSSLSNNSRGTSPSNNNNHHERTSTSIPPQVTFLLDNDHKGNNNDNTPRAHRKRQRVVIVSSASHLLSPPLPRGQQQQQQRQQQHANNASFMINNNNNNNNNRDCCTPPIMQNTNSGSNQLHSPNTFIQNQGNILNNFTTNSNIAVAATNTITMTTTSTFMGSPCSTTTTSPSAPSTPVISGAPMTPRTVAKKYAHEGSAGVHFQQQQQQQQQQSQHFAPLHHNNHSSSSLFLPSTPPQAWPVTSNTPPFDDVFLHNNTNNNEDCCFARRGTAIGLHQSQSQTPPSANIYMHSNNNNNNNHHQQQGHQHQHSNFNFGFSTITTPPLSPSRKVFYGGGDNNNNNICTTRETSHNGNHSNQKLLPTLMRLDDINNNNNLQENNSFFLNASRYLIEQVDISELRFFFEHKSHQGATNEFKPKQLFFNYALPVFRMLSEVREYFKVEEFRRHPRHAAAVNIKNSTKAFKQFFDSFYLDAQNEGTFPSGSEFMKKLSFGKCTSSYTTTAAPTTFGDQQQQQQNHHIEIHHAVIYRCLEIFEYVLRWPALTSLMFKASDDVGSSSHQQQEHKNQHSRRNNCTFPEEDEEFDIFHALTNSFLEIIPQENHNTKNNNNGNSSGIVTHQHQHQHIDIGYSIVHVIASLRLLNSFFRHAPRYLGFHAINKYNLVDVLLYKLRHQSFPHKGNSTLFQQTCANFLTLMNHQHLMPVKSKLIGTRDLDFSSSPSSSDNDNDDHDIHFAESHRRLRLYRTLCRQQKLKEKQENFQNSINSDGTSSTSTLAKMMRSYSQAFCNGPQLVMKTFDSEIIFGTITPEKLSDTAIHPLQMFSILLSKWVTQSPDAFTLDFKAIMNLVDIFVVFSAEDFFKSSDMTIRDRDDILCVLMHESVLSNLRTTLDFVCASCQRQHQHQYHHQQQRSRSVATSSYKNEITMKNHLEKFFANLKVRVMEHALPGEVEALNNQLCRF